MAREFVKAWFSMFTDEDFAQQPLGDKWLYVTLLGQPALNYAGVQPMNMRRWRKAMRDEGGIPAESVIEQTLVRLERRGYVFTDEDTGEVLIRSFMRSDQIDRQPNVLKSGLRALAQIESPKLAAVMVGELDRLTVPDVKSDKLGAEIDGLWRAARTHLEGLSKGLTEPFQQPFIEGLLEGLPEGFTRPGKIEPFPEGFAEGLPEGSVGVEVEVISPSEVLTLGSSRARADETDTARAAHDPIEPPTNPITPTNDPEPPSRCKAHADDPDHTAPCGPCANFRKAHDRWIERDARRKSEARSTAAHEAARLRAAEIDDCGLCDEHGYVGGRVCDHDPEAAERNARGMARVRAILGGGVER